jgi:hypothetical protein
MYHGCRCPVRSAGYILVDDCRQSAFLQQPGSRIADEQLGPSRPIAEEIDQQPSNLGVGGSNPSERASTYIDFECDEFGLG